MTVQSFVLAGAMLALIATVLLVWGERMALSDRRLRVQDAGISLGMAALLCAVVGAILVALGL